MPGRRVALLGQWDFRHVWVESCLDLVVARYSSLPWAFEQSWAIAHLLSWCEEHIENLVFQMWVQCLQSERLLVLQSCCASKARLSTTIQASFALNGSYLAYFAVSLLWGWLSSVSQLWRCCVDFYRSFWVMLCLFDANRNRSKRALWDACLESLSKLPVCRSSIWTGQCSSMTVWRQLLIRFVGYQLLVSLVICTLCKQSCLLKVIIEHLCLTWRSGTRLNTPRNWTKRLSFWLPAIPARDP